MIDKAEQIILGTILIGKEYQNVIIPSLDEELFTFRSHRLIFNCILKLHQKGANIDLLTVTNNFSKDDLKEIGGAYYISSLTNQVGSGLHWENHIRILKEHYIRTKLVELFSKHIANLNNKSIDIEETYLDVPKRVEELFNVIPNEFSMIYDVINDRIDDYDKATGKDLIGISTGHSMLNKITGGWQPGDLIILAARPSMGKTAFSLLFAKHPALQGKNVVYFSLEMPKKRIADRILSLECEIDSNKLISGKLEDWHWEQLMNHASRYSGIKLKIDDDSGLTIDQIKQRCLKEQSKNKIDLIVIDYLQLIQYPKGNQSTNDKVGYVSKSCKELAKKCDCPVIALSQLNRSVESRPGSKRPIMADLRDSGNIEQDADLIIFLHRPEYYGFEEDENGNSLNNVIENIVAKNRNGALGNTYSYRNDSWSYIGELPYEEYYSLNNSVPYTD